jgi:flagellar FliL protein
MSEAAAKKLPELKKDASATHAAVTAAPPKKDMLGIIVFALVTIYLVSVGGMGYFMQKMWGRVQELSAATQKLATAGEEEEEEAPATGKELEPQNLGILYPIESFLVNISSDQGPKFLQTQMEFELSEPALEDEIARKKPAIRDSIIVLLSSKSYKELREPAGMKKLRQDLLKSVNGLLSTGKVKEIYFTQFHFN